MEGGDRLGRRLIAERGEGRIAVPGTHDKEHRRRSEQRKQDDSAETTRGVRDAERRAHQPSSMVPNWSAKLE